MRECEGGEGGEDVRAGREVRHAHVAVFVTSRAKSGPPKRDFKGGGGIFCHSPCPEES